MRTKMFITISIFFCLSSNIVFGQGTFEDKYHLVLSKINQSQIDSIKVVKGKKITYDDIDSLLIKDYSLDVIGSEELSKFLDSMGGIMSIFILHEILLREDDLFLKTVANIYMMDLFGMRYRTFNEIYPTGNWYEFIPESNIIFFKTRIEMLENKFPDEIKESLNR